METTALVLAYVGVALMVGLAGVASSIGTAITGQAAVGAMKKNGGAFGSYMILSALPGSQGLYGFVCFFLVQKGLTDPTMVQGAAIFGAGLLVGLVNIASSIYQAKVCANGIAAIGNGHDVMGKTLILAAFPELYAILTVACHLPDRNARRRESLLTGRNARHRKGDPAGPPFFRCRPAVGALSNTKERLSWDTTTTVPSGIWVLRPNRRSFRDYRPLRRDEVRTFGPLPRGSSVRRAAAPGSSNSKSNWRFCRSARFTRMRTGLPSVMRMPVERPMIS